MRHIEAHRLTCHALAFSPDGLELVSAGKDGFIRVWDLAGHAPAHEWEAGGGAVLSLSVTSSHVIAGSSDGVVRMWSLAGVPRAKLPAEATAISGLCLLAHERYLAVAVGDRINSAQPGCLSIWDLQGEPKLVKRHGAPQGVWAVHGSAEEKIVLWGGGGKRVTRCDLAKQDLRFSPLQKREVRAVALSADNVTAAAGDDNAIHLLDSEHGQATATLTGHTGRVDALAFSSDRSLLSGGWDHHIREWDVSSGQERRAMNLGIGIIRTLAVAPDGWIAAAAGDRGVIAVWDLE